MENPEPLQLTAQTNDPLCFGANTGNILLNAQGGTPPYQYLWSNGLTSETGENLEAGNYSITLTDNNNCETTTFVTLSAPAELLLDFSTGNASCAGSNNGELTGLPSGGTPPYTYAWNTGNTNNAINNLAAGSYTLTVTDCLLYTSPSPRD